MKIVQIEDFFHPDAGYQVNILSKYLVKFGHSVTILTGDLEHIPERLTGFFGKEDIAGRDRLYETATGVRIVRLPLRAYVSGRAFFDGSLPQHIRAENPDILFAHGNDVLSGMWATLNRRKLGCPLVLDSHMLEMASENRLRQAFRLFYRTFFTPIIKRENLTVIRTQDDPYVEKCLGIPLTQAPWISYGSDTLLFHPDAAVKAAFRKAHGISRDAFVVVYAGKMDEAKGGRLLAELTAKTLHTDREVVYLIVGNAAGDYGREVEAAFTKSPYRVLRFPTQKYAELAPFFQCADLAVFPRQCSLSFYDVQACGLPVLFEDNNINVARCSHGNGWTFRAESCEDFAAQLERIVNLPAEGFASVSACALTFIRENYDYEAKAREYEQILLTQRDLWLKKNEKRG